LVELTPLTQGDEPVFYSVNHDSILPYTKPSPSIPMADSHGPNGSGAAFPDLPPAPASREFGHGYSANHPVPTVQSYKSVKEDNQKQADKYAEIVAQRQAEADERTRRSEEARKGNNIGAPQSGHKDDSNGHASETKQFDDEETNVVKTNKDKKHKPSGSKPATEKDRLMEQMNSNQSASSFGAILTVC